MLNKLILADTGSVHDGSYGNAKNLTKSAADCVKFQTHIAEAESLPGAPNPSYFSDETRIDYFKSSSFSFDQCLEQLIQSKLKISTKKDPIHTLK